MASEHDYDHRTAFLGNPRSGCTLHYNPRTDGVTIGWWGDSIRDTVERRQVALSWLVAQLDLPLKRKLAKGDDE